MPKGPQGQKRPADSIGCAVLVAQIATRELIDDAPLMPNRSAGAVARAKKLSPERCSEIASNAANSRWKK
jgi:hypothetical protein